MRTIKVNPIEKTVKESFFKQHFTFEKVLVLVAVLLVMAGIYETVTQSKFPALSIVALLQAKGYLKSYQVVYEPGKGIWLDLGWAGSIMMMVMMLYSVRKRTSLFNNLGSHRHWLAAHMFLGIMGPVLITFHTTFKLQGIVATSFWCMIITMVFGILGRYIYVQIPRSLTGAELLVSDIDELINSFDLRLGKHLKSADLTRLSGMIASSNAGEKNNLISALLFMITTDIKNRFRIIHIRRVLKKSYKLEKSDRKEILTHLKRKAALIRRKDLLAASHKLLHYWHVVHVPLAVVMFLIMFLHIGVHYLFRPGR